jgi:UDP-N-acetylmuramoyl-tripeptide--D-alanyl-D-alanine ligase
MMLTTKDVLDGLGETLVAARGPENASFGRAVIDSRLASAGDLFFALRGETVDGHDFVPAALESGAAGAVVARPVAAESKTQLQVSDPLTALQELASYWRRRHETVRVVGITGSVGKTTCKELIAAVLSSRFATLKSQANLNTEIGLPLTLLQLTPEHSHAVLELGMYVPGDIALLSRIARPDIGVVTNVGPVHLERAGSIGRITAGKAELIESLGPGGVALLNGDDPRVAAMARRTRARVILYGLSEQCDLRATGVSSRGLDGINFTMSYEGRGAVVECPLPGRHHVYPALAAAGVALNEGMTLQDVAIALKTARVDDRLTIRRGVRGSVLIDDSYNASPASVIAALDLLAEMPGRRIAVLGHMRELGAAEAAGHAQVGRHVAGRCDLLYVVGTEARTLAEEASRAGQPTELLETVEEAAAVLSPDLRKGDHVLIKASRAVGLEHLVAALAAEAVE